MLILNKQAGHLNTKMQAQPSVFWVVVFNFFRLHHPALPYVIGGLIQEETTRSLTLFNLPSCHRGGVFFPVVPEILGGVGRSEPL